jgi:capsular polysaccharide transport system ATP-binding protein
MMRPEISHRNAMIAFRNVSKFYNHSGGVKYILNKASFVLPERNIGILGMNGAGKSTLVRMIGGAEAPNKGRIDRFTRISWPLGFSGGTHLALSGSENIRFVARIYGEDPERVHRFVADFSELGKYLNMPVATYSSGMRAKLMFGLSMAIDFECYLIDEITAVGDQNFQQKCREVFSEKKKNSKVIIVSHNESTIRSYCDYGILLGDGKVRFYSDLNDAIRVYNAEMVGES